jgi:hypothetical protein
MEGSTSVGDGHGWSEQLSEREVRAVVLQTRSTAAAAAAPRFLSASVAALLVHSTAAPSSVRSTHSTAVAVAAPSVHSTATAAAPRFLSASVAAPAVHSIARTSHAYPNPGKKRRYQKRKREAKAAERARGLHYVYTQVHFFCNNL